MSSKSETQSQTALGGIAGGIARGVIAWMGARFRGREKCAPRLELLERITLGPRQSLALIEAEGRRLLVATSQEGGPAFYALDGTARKTGSRQTGSRAARTASTASARVSW